jgi:hypothetical protein
LRDDELCGHDPGPPLQLAAALELSRAVKAAVGAAAGAALHAARAGNSGFTLVRGGRSHRTAASVSPETTRCSTCCRIPPFDKLTKRLSMLGKFENSGSIGDVALIEWRAVSILRGGSEPSLGAQAAWAGSVQAVNGQSSRRRRNHIGGPEMAFFCCPRPNHQDRGARTASGLCSCRVFGRTNSIRRALLSFIGIFAG